jgi:hypothetical protein
MNSSLLQNGHDKRKLDAKADSPPSLEVLDRLPEGAPVRGGRCRRCRKELRRLNGHKHMPKLVATR